MFKGKKFLALALVLAFVAAIAVGCGGNTASQSGEGGDKAKAAPDKVYKWKIVTCWPEALALHQMPVELAKILNETSGGRMEVEVFPDGAIVGAAEVLDAVNARTADAYHDYPGYWIGKIPSSPFIASVPMIMEPFMYLGWMYEGGGLELIQKAYDEAGYNIKLLVLGVTHPEQLAVSNKPMQTFDDFTGLKYRTVGWWGEILRDVGVSVTSVPGAEVYPSLERGIIDAAEFSTPGVNRALGFEEVTKYISGPGMHQPGTLFTIGINKDSWNELPPDLQLLVESSARSVTLWGWCKDLQDSMNAVDYFEEKGVQKVTADPAVQQKLYEETIKLLDAKAQEEGGTFAEIWESMQSYRDRLVDYEEFMMPIRAE
ncbi:MAG: TRAP transporter substrate-binding protein DctP [Firmicutes bacterium]|nr:TRAP transporter substrate-binding protein DctP [Bacillota bacterium]